MKLITLLAAIIMAAAALALAGCGGGGGAAPANYYVSGVASKGPISGGTVKVYALSNGVKGTDPLGSATTGSDGSYSVPIGAYTGPVLVEISGGSYTDEATGANVTVPATPAFLRAALPNLSGSVTVAITPLTELAVRRATDNTGNLPTDAITNANQVVSELFGLSDIVGVKPVAPTSTAINATGVNDDQKTYTLVLAAISQLAGGATTTAVDAAITALNGGIDADSNIMSIATADNVNAALTTYLAPENSTNKTAVAASDPLVTAFFARIGRRTATLTVRATGITSSNVYGIDATITLPSSGYQFAFNPTTYLVDSAKISTSTGGYAVARYVDTTTPKTMTVAVAKGNAAIADGALMSVQFVAYPGFNTTTVTVVAAASLFKDVNGNPLTIAGTPLTVTVQ